MLAKTIANCKIVRYNHFRVGAWCSGSTWASDSHGVGSIPIAPANATHPRDERGCFFFLPQGAPMRPCGRKRKSTVLRCVALIPQKGALGKIPSPVREHSYNTRPFYLHSSFLQTKGAPMRPCGRKRKSTVLRCVALIPQKGAPGKLPNPVREHSYDTRPFYLHSSFLRTGRTHAPPREKKKVHRLAVRSVTGQFLLATWPYMKTA